MESLKIMGVPEHFNLPWHLAIESGKFDKEGLSVEWVDEPGGTGAMTKALRDQEVDCSVLLTEGIVSDICKGNPSRIISGYVVSPLIWGIHTGAKNELQHHSEIYDKRYAISRFGSGSHLMPQVDALTQELTISEDQFHVIRNLEGALTSLTELETDVFYWEKYTTKPFVDSGQLRRIGEFITPWPCFVIAATQKCIEEKSEALVKMLRIIQAECTAFMKKNIISIAQVSDRYEQKAADVERWFHSTVWADHSKLNPQTIQNVIYSLQQTGVIEEAKRFEELIWE